MRRKIDALTAI